MILFQSLEISDLRGRRHVGPLEVALDPTKRTALLGPSGSGKTLLIRALFGALPNDFVVSGTIQVSGRPLGISREPAFWRRMAWVPQRVDEALNPWLSVADHLTLRPVGLEGEARAKALVRLAPLVERLGLPPLHQLERRKPNTLSGGQRQRLLLAMALSLSRGPDLLVLDEPTTGLDALTQRSLLDLLEDLRHERGFGWIWVTHDLALATSVSDHLVVLDEGRLLAQGSPTERLEAPPGGTWDRLLEAARTRISPR